MVLPFGADAVVDVDSVAARDVADETTGSGDEDRDRPLLPASCVGIASVRPVLEVGGRDLLSGRCLRRRHAR